MSTTATINLVTWQQIIQQQLKPVSPRDFNKLLINKLVLNKEEFNQFKDVKFDKEKFAELLAKKGTLKEACRFTPKWNDAFTYYEDSGKELGRYIEYEGYALKVPKKQQGQGSVGIIGSTSFANVSLKDNVVTFKNQDKITVTRNFPSFPEGQDNEGWFWAALKSGIATGKRIPDLAKFNAFLFEAAKRAIVVYLYRQPGSFIGGMQRDASDDENRLAESFCTDGRSIKLKGNPKDLAEVLTYEQAFNMSEAARRQ